MPMKTRIHQPLPHQYPPRGILLHHHRPEQFLEGDDLPWIKFLGHAELLPIVKTFLRPHIPKIVSVYSIVNSFYDSRLL